MRPCRCRAASGARWEVYAYDRAPDDDEPPQPCLYAGCAPDAGQKSLKFLDDLIARLPPISEEERARLKQRRIYAGRLPTRLEIPGLKKGEE